MSKLKSPKAPKFHNVAVTLKAVPSGGNTAGGKYIVKCLPDTVNVVGGDAIINYQLTKAPAGIVFTGFDHSGSSADRELSKPSISVDGKMMTFSDINLEEGPILITLKFRDDTEILFDPEVSNET